MLSCENVARGEEPELYDFHSTPRQTQWANFACGAVGVHFGCSAAVAAPPLDPGPALAFASTPAGGM